MKNNKTYNTLLLHILYAKLSKCCEKSHSAFLKTLNASVDVKQL